MSHEALRGLVARYTPSMLPALQPAGPEEVDNLERLAGPFPESYRDFLGWMGNRCPFLDGEEVAYSPEQLLDFVYEDPDIQVTPGYLLVGVDLSGGAVGLHLRRSDEAVVRLTLEYEPGDSEGLLLEGTSWTSYLLASYVRRTLAPSHPYHFAAAMSGESEHLQDLWRRVDQACSHFAVPFPVVIPDLRFYGGDDFVLGVHQRPGSSVTYLHFGAIDRTRHEPWYDLVFARWRLRPVPV